MIFIVIIKIFYLLKNTLKEALKHLYGIFILTQFYT